MAGQSVGFKLKVSSEQGKKSLQALNKEIKETKENTLQLGDAIKQAFSKETAIIGFVKSIGSMINMMTKAAEAEAEYVESMNLMQVAYHTNTEEGEKLYNQTSSLINEMNRFLGLDPSTLTRQVGVYKQMTNAMGMTNEQSALLSENLIKLQTDVASLYNLEGSEVASKFQSALAGQTRAVRSLGVDITQASLQQELYNQGINKSFSELSRADKEALIYLSMVRQLKDANGDAAKTMNSVANQTKLFKIQIGMAARQIGAVFIPILKKILPIANAILIVFNDIMSIILGIFGVNAEEMASEFGIALSDTNDEILDMSDGFDKATKSAKKLLGLRGFDKLNNITTPSDSGNDDKNKLGGGAGGISSKLNDAIKEYNLQLEKTKNKAKEIAEWIEKWLIYTDENGKKHLTILGKILVILGVGGTLYKGLKVIWTIVDMIAKLTGGKGIFGVLSKIGSAIGSLGLGTVLAIVLGILEGVGKILQFIENIKLFIERLKSGQNLIEAMLPQSSEELVERLFYTLPFSGLLRVIDEVSGHKLNLDANIEKVAEKLDEVKQWFEDTKNWIHDNIIQPIVDFITPIAETIYNDVIEPVTDYISTLFTSIYDGIANVLSNIWEVVSGVATALWEIWTKIAEIFGKIIEIFVALGKAAYTYIIKPIVDFVASVFKWIWDKILKPVIDVLGKAASWAYDHIIKPIWDKFWWLKEKVVEIFSGIWKKVSDFGMGVIKGAINGVYSVIEKTINFFIKALNGAISLINKIPGVDISKVEELHITRLADGGFVDEGQMFIAREAGPEMVGTINGKTAVANNDQIVQGITNGVMMGVARAMQQSGGTQNVVIEAQGDTEGLLNFITFKQKEKDRQFGM